MSWEEGCNTEAQVKKRSIFAVFCRISASAFGGGYTVLPLLQKELVDDQGWFSEEELTDNYALSQCLPGLMMINMSILCVKPRFGAAAALTACLGVILPPLVIVLLIAALLGNFAHIPMVQHALAGMRCAVAALVVWSAWRLIRSGVKDIVHGFLFAAALVLLFFDWASPIIIVVAAAAIGIVLGRLRGGERS